MSVIGPFTITWEEMGKFLVLYDREGKFPNQRFGQAFCNHFNLVWPEVFYQEKRKEAEALIYLRVK
jgi:hypothetical protein